MRVELPEYNALPFSARRMIDVKNWNGVAAITGATVDQVRNTYSNRVDVPQSVIPVKKKVTTNKALTRETVMQVLEGINGDLIYQHVCEPTHHRYHGHVNANARGVLYCRLRRLGYTYEEIARYFKTYAENIRAIASATWREDPTEKPPPPVTQKQRILEAVAEGVTDWRVIAQRTGATQDRIKKVIAESRHES